MTATPPLPRRIRLAGSVSARLGAERGFLFDPQTGRVYSLNATGALVAAGIERDAPIAEIIDAMVEAFEVDEATVRRDLARFAAHLAEERLVELDG